jgi:hypothetical protein
MLKIRAEETSGNSETVILILTKVLSMKKAFVKTLQKSWE